MQAGFAAMVFSANDRKSGSDIYPGCPSILLSDSQLYTPGRLENLRNHFPMGVPCLTLLLELFSELSLVFICSSEPSALQKSTASIVLPQQQYHPRGDNFTARYSSSNSPILFSIVISRECPATILSARLFSSPGILALRIVFAIGSGCVPEQFPVLTEGLLLYPARYAPTHFFM